MGLLPESPASGDLRDYIQRILAGNPEAERRFIPEFVEVTCIMIRHDQQLAYIPCPVILARKALHSFLWAIKEGRLKETDLIEKLHAELKKHACNTENIAAAIDVHLKAIVKGYRRQQQHDPDWQSKMADRVRNAYNQYVFYLFDQKDTPGNPVRPHHSQDELAEKSLKDLVKILIKDVEEENTHYGCGYYGYLIRRIVHCDLSDELKSVNTHEQLAGEISYEVKTWADREKVEDNLVREKVAAIICRIKEKYLCQLQQDILDQKYGKGKKLEEIAANLSDLQQKGYIKMKRKIDASFISKELKKSREKMLKILKQKGIHSLSDLY